MSTASFRTAERLAKRLKLFQKMAIQAEERGDEHVMLHRDELWDCEDEAALTAFEKLAEQHSGQRRLPLEEA